MNINRNIYFFYISLHAMFSQKHIPLHPATTARLQAPKTRSGKGVAATPPPFF